MMQDEYEHQSFWQKDPIIEHAEWLMDMLGYEKCREGWKAKNKQDNGKA